MKTLLVAEQREGKLLNSVYELVAFSDKLGANSAMFLVGDGLLPQYDGTLYLADVTRYKEYSPAVHKQLLLDVIEKERPDIIVFSHSSYGWDLAPRIAIALNAAQISEVVDIANNAFVVSVCNSKLRRNVLAKTAQTVVTLQGGAFGANSESTGTPRVEKIETDAVAQVEFCGYEAAEKNSVDLTRARTIVSAGRGIGKADNMAMISQLADILGGEYGASRPVVDSKWTEQNRQIGTTGQTVSPQLYIACGISGAIQHLSGMKKSEFIIAINRDKDAPIGEIADILAVADVKELLPALIQRLINSPLNV